MTRHPFVDYMKDWIRQYGTQQRLADKVGMTSSAFSHGLRQKTFSLETLLRFIVETGEPADKVLGLAGKADIAELLKQVYQGPGAPMSAPHRDLLELWDSLPKNEQAPLLQIMRGLARERRPPRKPRR